MERKISLNDLRVAVDEAYEHFKSDKEGTPDPRIANADAKSFGISVVLTDGTTINKADTTKKFALGQIAKLPLHELLLQQMNVTELLKKSGFIKGKIEKPSNLGVSAHGLRAFSAVTPSGDPDGKWDIIINNLIDLMGTEPVLDDKLYELLKSDMAKAQVEDKLAQFGFYLYDDAKPTIDGYVKLMSMTVDTEQLATLGATIAADGKNPKTGKIVFDGELSAPLTALAALHGPHKRSIPWLMKVGLPAKSSFSGAIVAIMPGLGAIAAYSPKLAVESGISQKAWEAIEYIARKLDLNVFSSARVVVE